MNPKDIENLLNIAGKKLNVSPDVLKKQLESGQFNSMMKGMSKQDTDKIQKILKNPKLAEQMMSSSEVQNMYKNINKK